MTDILEEAKKEYDLNCCYLDYEIFKRLITEIEKTRVERDFAQSAVGMEVDKRKKLEAENAELRSDGLPKAFNDVMDQTIEIEKLEAENKELKEKYKVFEPGLARSGYIDQQDEIKDLKAKVKELTDDLTDFHIKRLEG